jgi:exodeoxyribonuclease VII small subunit
MTESELNSNPDPARAAPVAGAPSFEASLAELQSIVDSLEDGQLDLAVALERYEQGVRHLKTCYALLAEAEQKIELLTRVAEDGRPVTQPFVVTSDQPVTRPDSRRAKARPPKSKGDDELPGFGRDIDG